MEELNEEEMKGTEGGACSFGGGDEVFFNPMQVGTGLRYKVADNVTAIYIKNISYSGGNELKLTVGETKYIWIDDGRAVFSFMKGQFRASRKGFSRPFSFNAEVWYNVYSLPNQTEKTIASGRVNFKAHPRKKTFRITLP